MITVYKNCLPAERKTAHMTEKIGNVSLVLDDYPGRDIYSDGEIEDELLEIAKTTAPDQFDRVVAEKKNWAVMYHFSTIRTNILSWYPFKKTDSVLEIGSGCGAITGAVAMECMSISSRWMSSSASGPSFISSSASAMTEDLSRLASSRS